MHRRGRQSLFNAVAGRFVFQRRHRNHMDALRQRVAPPRHVISAASDPHRTTHQSKSNPPPHGTNFSASFTAFHAGNRILSAAPQIHQVPSPLGSCSGWARTIDFSPATLTLLGPPSSSEAITNSASLQTSAMLWPLSTSTVAHALKVAP